jgi:hypothetical protein
VPTKKQRRRQQKTRRHEWEYVYVDEEGEEVEVDPAEVRAAKESEKEKERPRAGAPARRTDARGRPIRQVQPPSWRRTLRRAVLFGPLFVVALMLLDRHGSIAARLVAAVPLVIFLIPWLYFTDWLAYRTYQKRVVGGAKPAAKASAKPKAR